MSDLVSERRKKKTGGELALIGRIRRRAASGARSSTLKLGIGDDCAILQIPRGHELLVTTDFSLEGRHFRRDWHSPESVGHRTLARGLSDLASMGAKPLSAFLSLALPKSVACDTRWIKGFLDGFMALAKTHNVPLAGGDTAEAPTDHVLVDIILLGSTPTGTALRRSSARVGDLLYCTGALGGSSVELASLPTSTQDTSQAAKEHPHLFPAPRLLVGEALRKSKLATACIDLSDGLSTDLAHLCTASGVSADVEAGALPLHALTTGMSSQAALEAALHGGEDYELLFAAPPEVKLPRTISGVPITQIGRLLPLAKRQPQISLVDLNGNRLPLKPAGWEHLR